VFVDKYFADKYYVNIHLIPLQSTLMYYLNKKSQILSPKSTSFKSNNNNILKLIDGGQIVMKYVKFKKTDKIKVKILLIGCISINIYSGESLHKPSDSEPESINISFEDSKQFYSLPIAILDYSGTLKHIFTEGHKKDIQIANINDKIGSKLIEILKFLLQNKQADNLRFKIENLNLDNDAFTHLFNAIHYLNIDILKYTMLNIIKTKLKIESLSNINALLKTLLLKLNSDLIPQLIKEIPPFVKLQESKEYLDAHLDPNKNKILIQDKKDNLYLLNEDGEKIQLMWDYEGSYISDITMSSNANKIAAIYDEKLYLFNSDGKRIQLVGTNSQRDYINVSINLDGNKVTAIGTDNQVYLFNGDGTEIPVKLPNYLYYENVLIGSTGNIMATIGYISKNYIRNDPGDLYLIDSEGEYASVRGSNPTREYYDVNLSSDGKRIISKGKNKVLYIFAIYDDIYSHGEGNIGISKSYSINNPKGNRIITIDINSNLHMFDINGNEIQIKELNTQQKYKKK
jgi:transcriptional regulator of met regulon